MESTNIILYLNHNDEIVQVSVPEDILMKSQYFKILLSRDNLFNQSIIEADVIIFKLLIRYIGGTDDSSYNTPKQLLAMYFLADRFLFPQRNNIRNEIINLHFDVLEELFDVNDSINISLLTADYYSHMIVARHRMIKNDGIQKILQHAHKTSYSYNIAIYTCNESLIPAYGVIGANVETYPQYIFRYNNSINCRAIAHMIKTSPNANSIIINMVNYPDLSIELFKSLCCILVNTEFIETVCYEIAKHNPFTHLELKKSIITNPIHNIGRIIGNQILTEEYSNVFYDVLLTNNSPSWTILHERGPLPYDILDVIINFDNCTIHDTQACIILHDRDIELLCLHDTHKSRAIIDMLGRYDLIIHRWLSKVDIRGIDMIVYFLNMYLSNYSCCDELADFINILPNEAINRLTYRVRTNCAYKLDSDDIQQNTNVYHDYYINQLNQGLNKLLNNSINNVYKIPGIDIMNVKPYMISTPITIGPKLWHHKNDLYTMLKLIDIIIHGFPNSLSEHNQMDINEDNKLFLINNIHYVMKWQNYQFNITSMLIFLNIDPAKIAQCKTIPYDSFRSYATVKCDNNKEVFNKWMKLAGYSYDVMPSISQ